MYGAYRHLKILQLYQISVVLPKLKFVQVSIGRKGIQFSRALPDPYLIDPVSHWSLVFESEIFFLLFDLRSDICSCCIIINAILSPL
ncbi:hypothetical protein XELAEV_18021421mg [Xenopus laevis]|uniref:Uncharacterized protein n=1 Tax=Xenopus laevis TaxID=8355 RepID=A0A974HRU3_XENLA|nr:hypothetical protein XELAEV_18021421mg [Xenopus laevis]